MHCVKDTKPPPYSTQHFNGYPGNKPMHMTSANMTSALTHMNGASYDAKPMKRARKTRTKKTKTKVAIDNTNNATLVAMPINSQVIVTSQTSPLLYRSQVRKNAPEKPPLLQMTIGNVNQPSLNAFNKILASPKQGSNPGNMVTMTTPTGNLATEQTINNCIPSDCHLQQRIDGNNNNANVRFFFINF